MQCYVSSLDTRTSRVPQHYNGKIVLFPGAESFNAIPVDLCKAIEERFGSLVMFVLHKSDRAAQEAGEKLRNVFFVDNIDDTLLLIARNYPIAVDSFVSHLIQLITDEATIIFSREVRERFVHPGARPRTIEMTPECAPCEYVSMRKSAVCPIGRTTCVAFESLFPLLEREILLVQRNLEIKMVQRQTRHE